MKIRFVLILLCVGLISVGCAKTNETAEDVLQSAIISSGNSEEYDILSDGTVQTRNYTVKTADLIHVEKSMIRLCKEVFPTKSHVLGQGTYLDNNDLTSLLAAESAMNPYGLNMDKNAELIDDQQTLPAMRNLISNMTELDFFSKEDPSKCTGIAICLLLNTTVKDYSYAGYEISLDTAVQYGKQAGQKVVKMLRETKEDLREVPIFIMLYSLASEDESLAGVMVAKGTAVKDTISYTDIEEKWLIFPSAQATREDAQTVAMFQLLKEAVNDYTKETVTMIATGHYLDNEIDELKITVRSYSAAYLYNLGLVQVLSEKCDEFGPIKMKLVIEIQYYDDTIFTVSKDIGSQTCTVQDLS